MVGIVLCVVILGMFPMFVTSKFQNAVDYERQDWEKIVGGTKAPNGSAPYQVSLRYKRRHFCGASILSPRVILSAAHCVDGLTADRFQAVVGTNQLRSGGQSYSIRKVVPHEKYDPDLIHNDIALIFTEKAMEFNSVTDAIERNDEPVEDGEDLRLTGWGTTTYPGFSPNNLMQINLNAVGYEKCKEAHKSSDAPPIYKSQVCAMAKTIGGACHGDSGGPLVREGRQVGIVSWGIPCARGKPDVYTSVEAFRDWIDDTLNEDDADHLVFINNKQRKPSANHLLGR